jgi:hypothetical protein
MGVKLQGWKGDTRRESKTELRAFRQHLACELYLYFEKISSMIFSATGLADAKKR